jgi:hypothetical protein
MGSRGSRPTIGNATRSMWRIHVSSVTVTCTVASGHGAARTSRIWLVSLPHFGGLPAQASAKAGTELAAAIQKELRLLEARPLLKTGGDSFTTTSYEVGHESSSQFSREYAPQVRREDAHTRLLRCCILPNGRGALPHCCDARAERASGS